MQVSLALSLSTLPCPFPDLSGSPYLLDTPPAPAPTTNWKNLLDSPGSQPSSFLRGISEYPARGFPVLAERDTKFLGAG